MVPMIDKVFNRPEELMVDSQMVARSSLIGTPSNFDNEGPEEIDFAHFHLHRQT